MHACHVTVEEGFSVFGVPTLLADVPPSLGMHHLDVPVQAALSVRGVVALFAEVVLDPLVHRLHVFLHVAGRVRRVRTRYAAGGHNSIEKFRLEFRLDKSLE